MTSKATISISSFDICCLILYNVSHSTGSIFRYVHFGNVWGHAITFTLTQLYHVSPIISIVFKSSQSTSGFIFSSWFSSSTSSWFSSSFSSLFSSSISFWVSLGLFSLVSFFQSSHWFVFLSSNQSETSDSCCSSSSQSLSHWDPLSPQFSVSSCVLFSVSSCLSLSISSHFSPFHWVLSSISHWTLSESHEISSSVSLPESHESSLSADSKSLREFPPPL